jgi:DNA-binding transcriptional regulator YiaG
MTAGKTSGLNRSEMIKKLRKQLGLTQEQFAAKVGVTFSTVNRWEAGRSKPSPLAWREVERLAKSVGKAKR